MIFTVHHKEFPYIKNKLYQPIQVGAENTKIQLNFLKDNTGNNISSRNNTFAELTALYWIWKNYDLDSLDFIGLSHYRRFFDFSYKKLFVKKSRKEENIKILTSLCNDKYYDRIKKALTKNDILITKHDKWKEFSIHEQYIDWHISDDWDKMVEVIKKLYPEYKQSIQEAWYTVPCNVHLYNMFIMKIEDYKSYMEWLFTILFELENKINLADKQHQEDPYQTRVFGFLSERLLNLYIYHQKFSKKEFQNILIS
ncbi:DUF4422 domain-containing protein [Flammeovirga pectinis]|uniref:DUF4422 domain-containing protein n=1 Tax=Flammeovirga pectinis TaxID=2494373 RepID=A0A3Q9FQ80_9BACT|nr:DUF4422 domain-containing protein [Flammeovirga pectinis]AZQ63509.1 DUF4422 domain-containing protein [Flammeovirga pectinis]